MKDSILKRRLARGVSRVCAAILLVGGPMGGASCTDDLLTGSPTWLGSSIYEELESRGDFQTTLALINDPDLTETNYPEMLRRTGSVTLFVADDAAWAKFLKARGVSSVGDLSKAEKKNLLKGAMINNAYLIELLGNLPGNPPSEGVCLRRPSRVNIGDSIPVVPASEMPVVNPARLTTDANGSEEVIDYWSSVRDRENILMFKDNNAPTMLHLVPDFMTRNDIVQEDIQRLTNGECEDIDRSYINGVAIALNDGRWPEKDVNPDGSAKKFLQDITCQNGYIHVLEQVPEQLPNMAEIIRTKPQFSIFSSLLERFTFPQYIGMMEVDGQRDSLFVKRYFNNGNGTNAIDNIPGTTTSLGEVLALDPGWNNYCINTTNDQITSANDGAAIFVPTNEYMEQYLSTSGDGSAIGAKYGYDWNNVPDAVVLPFLNNCMKSSFISTTPSKFASVKNTQSEDMGVTIDQLDSCFIACNGVVYEMSAAYVAPDHQSVFFPVLLRQDEDMAVLYKYIKDVSYKPTSDGSKAYDANWTGYENDAYVNSMASTYSFLLPTDAAFAGYRDTDLGAYIDPYSIQVNKPIAYSFYVDPSAKDFPVSARAFQVDTLNGQVSRVNFDVDGTPQPTNPGAKGLGLINNRLGDLLNNLLVVHGQKGAQTFHPGQTIYLNKAGGPVQVQFQGDKVVGVAGSAQMERGTFIPVREDRTFDQTGFGNGVSYIIDSIPSSTLTAPYALIHDSINHPTFGAFADILTQQLSRIVGSYIGSASHPTLGTGITILGNYHYTIYVPAKESIDALVAAHKLPTWEEYDAWKDYYDDAFQKNGAGLLSDEELEEIKTLSDSCRAVIETVMENFVRYHVQDGSVYMGGEEGTAVYETASYDDETSLFHRLNVQNTNGTITVRDEQGNTARVLKNGHSNLVSRQYVFDTNNQWIYGSSYVVIHEIDQPLIYSADELLPDGFPFPGSVGAVKRTTKQAKR